MRLRLGFQNIVTETHLKNIPGLPRADIPIYQTNIHNTSCSKQKKELESLSLLTNQSGINNKMDIIPNS